MPAPRWLAHFNRRFLNPILDLLAGRVPPFMRIVHRGRKSGREYRTVIWGHRRGPDFVVFLTYGARSDWVQNVLAAGEAVLEHTGGRSRVFNPRLVTDPSEIRALAPWLLRPILLHVIRVNEVLLLSGP